MNRVLSIEQSRGCSGQSVYVTKRLCISMVFSIGFLCILGGYLIGHTSSEHNKANKIQSDDNKDFKDVLKVLSTEIDKLMKATSNITVSVAEVQQLKGSLDDLFEERILYLPVVKINDFHPNSYLKEIISSKLTVLVDAISDADSVISKYK